MSWRGASSLRLLANLIDGLGGNDQATVSRYPATPESRRRFPALVPSLVESRLFTTCRFRDRRGYSHGLSRFKAPCGKRRRVLSSSAAFNTGPYTMIGLK